MYPGSPAEEYIKARGLDEVAAAFGLGYVGSALPGHERYRGYLAIPYLRPAGGADGVATVRYRCIADECVRGPDSGLLVLQDEKEHHQGHGKYMTAPGDPPRLYNTAALIQPTPYVVVVEGELDAMTWALAGVPAVGAPGTGTWQPYWTPPLRGYRTVYLIAEDGPGLNFMDALAAELPNARIIQMPGDRDSNATFLKEGREALLERIGH
ncbi:topoisomerase [Streptomyces flavofungini]|uniref:topoisomerase n=1 Tax=Streptomyces flavofungini TaxID=68200 RepID=UPI00339D86F6